MKNIYKYYVYTSYLIVLLAVISESAVVAQSTETIVFQNITPDDGLPITSVTDVTQDSYGYIWIGSWDGVYRYDGSQFEKKSPQGRYLEADKKGGVWISYGRGGPLAYYNSVQDSLHIFEIDLDKDFYPKVRVGAAGRVWSGSDKGVLLFNESLEKFESDSTQEPGYSFNVISHTDSSISFIYRNAEDEWGIGHRTFGGNHSFQKFPSDQNKSDPSIPVNATEVRLNGYKSNGLLLVNEFGWATKESQHESWQFFKTPNTNLLKNVATVLFREPNQLWVYKTYSLTKIDISTGQYTGYGHNQLNQKSLLSSTQGNTGVELFIDRQEVLWIPSFAIGISRLNLYENNFGLLRMLWGPLRDVISAVELEDGSFWIGARIEGNSLFYFDPSANVLGNVLKQYSGLFGAPPGKSTSTELSHPYVWSLANGSDGSIWAGTGSPGPNEGGLNRIRPGSNEITRFKHDPNDEASLYPGNWVSKIIEDGSGRIWFKDFKKMAWVDPITEIITRYNHPENSGITDEETFVVLGTNSGDLIVSSENNRYYLIHHEDLSIENIDLKIERPAFTSIYIQDSDNRFWVSSYDGFGLLDTSLTKIEKWYDIDVYDFPISTLSSLQFDGDGNAWLGTNNGIVKFNLNTEKVTHYLYERGLQGYNFDGRVNYKGPSGKLYFGGNGGINIFDPTEITENPHPPEMVFTNFSFDGNQVQFGSDQPIEAPLEITKKILIQPDILSISIEFRALHFAGNQSNQYQYQLVGFDNDWREGGTFGRATYTNLSPGYYTFRIKGSNLDGVWSDGSTSILLVVLPPWWRTWWAYGAYLIIFALGVLAVDRYQRRRLIKRERERARERELEQQQAHASEIQQAYQNLETAHENLKSAQEQLIQQEKLASLGQLTAGIAHEIKNPLNFVNNFSDVSIEMVDEARDELKLIKALKSSDADKIAEEIEMILTDVESNLRKIHEHGSRADRIVKSMLLHSRGGEGERRPTDLNALIEEYVHLSYHGMRAGPNRIDCEIELDLDNKIDEIIINPEEISRVIVNVCNNAFDAMGQKSEKAKVKSERSNVRGDSKRTGEPLSENEGSIRQLAESGDSSAGGKPGMSSSEVYHPKLTVRTILKASAVIIEIKDNGAGIPDRIKNKILQPFFTTKKGTEGTGLGLSISSNIVKAHGGVIHIESVEDRYTLFQVSIPTETHEV